MILVPTLTPLNGRKRGRSLPPAPPANSVVGAWDADASVFDSGFATSSLTTLKGTAPAMGQSAAGSQPIMTLGGLNGHNFFTTDAVDDYLESLFGALAQPFTVGMVMRQNTSGAGERIFDTASGSQCIAFHFVDPEQITQFAGSAFTNPVTVGTGAWVYYQSIFDGANSKARTNKEAWTGPDSPGAQGLNGLRVGINVGLTAPAGISVAAFFIQSINGEAEGNANADFYNGRFNLF